MRGIRRILRNGESSRGASFTQYTAYSLSEKKRFRRSCPDAAESETGGARISSRTAPALHTPRGKGVRLPPACETFLDHPQASRRRASLPPAHETQHASSFQEFLSTPARTKRRAALDALKGPSAPKRHHKRRSGGGSPFFMRDGNLFSGEIKTRAAFLRSILRHTRLSRDARLRRILRIFPAPRKGFITQYTAYRFPSLKDAFHALGGMTPAFVFPSFVPAPGFPSLSRIPSVPSSPLFPPPALPAFPEGGLARCDRLSRWGLSLPLAAVRCAFSCLFPLTAPFPYADSLFFLFPALSVVWLGCHLPLPAAFPPMPCPHTSSASRKEDLPTQGKKRPSILEIEFHFHYALSTRTLPARSKPGFIPRRGRRGRQPSFPRHEAPAAAISHSTVFSLPFLYGMGESGKEDLYLQGSLT